MTREITMMNKQKWNRKQKHWSSVLALIAVIGGLALVSDDGLIPVANAQDDLVVRTARLALPSGQYTEHRLNSPHCCQFARLLLLRLGGHHRRSGRQPCRMRTSAFQRRHSASGHRRQRHRRGQTGEPATATLRPILPVAARRVRVR